MKRVISLGIPAVCSVLFLAASGSALAKPQSVFMLQFGSFESSDEANERVSALKSKHAGLIGGMSSRVQEVSLPDNLTVYRTQAGPVASRAEAQSICAQLASNGDECYVVETAMTETPATTAVAKAETPRSVTFSKPDAAAPTLETLNTAQQAANTAPATATVPLPKFEAAQTGANSVSSAREQARASLQSDRSAVSALEAAPPITTRTSSLAAAPAAQASTAQAPEQTMERPSFWSRLNPFSDDEETKPAIKAQAPEPVETAVAKVDAQPVTSLRPALPESVPVTPAQTHADSAMPLLPPPPPMNGTAKEIFERNQQQAPVLAAQAPVSAPVAPAPAPEPTGSVPMIASVAPAAPAAANGPVPFAHASNETLARVGKPATAPGIRMGDGSVSVGEAQRVPLTNAMQQADTTPMFRPSGSMVAPPDASIPIRPGPRQITAPQGVLAAPEVLLPASQNTQKTLWAELRPFKDAPTALGFWDQFRGKNPDFPVVRVRVIQSYQQKLRGQETVALRVGPFAKRESIGYLCGQLKSVESMQCGQVVDMGVSSSQSRGRSRVVGGEYNLAAQTMTAQAMPGMQNSFWLQLGTYQSMGQAEDAWRGLKQRYGRVLGNAKSSIVTPQLSSGASPVYRLRSGPFTSETDATKACLALKNAGGNCIVSGNTQ